MFANSDYYRVDYIPKIHSILIVFFPVYENKVLQLMSGGASLEKFGEKGLLENLRHQKVILKLTDL